MSDDDVGADAPDVEPVEPVEPDQPDAEVGDDDELVPVSKLREMREENASYRKRYQPFERAFADFDDEDREFLLSWLPTFRSDPQAFLETAETIVRSLKELTPSEEAQVADEVATAEAEANAKGEDLTPERIEEIVNAKLEERERTAAEERARAEAVEKVIVSVEERGFARGTPEHHDILRRMAQETDGDLDKAIEAHEQWRQSLIDGFVAQKNAPTPPPAGGEAPAPSKTEPRNIREAQRMAAEAVRARQG